MAVVAMARPFMTPISSLMTVSMTKDIEGGVEERKNEESMKQQGFSSRFKTPQSRFRSSRAETSQS